MAQILSLPSTDPLLLGSDFHMDPGAFEAFDPSDMFSTLPSSVWDSAAAVRPYENDTQNDPFNPHTTLEPTPSTFIPPSSMGMFNPHLARANFTAATATAQNLPSGLPRMSRKRGLSPAAAHDEGEKRRRIDQHLVGQRVGARQVDHHGITVTNGETNAISANRGPLIGLPAANQRLMKVIKPPIASFDRPEHMSRDEYVALLEAKIHVEHHATLEYLV